MQNLQTEDKKYQKKLQKEEKKRLKFEKKEQKHFKHRLNEICPLSHLKVKQIGEVLSLNNDNKALRRRLMDMGVTKGVQIEIRRISPLGDPIDVSLRGYDLCLRKVDMDGIQVKVVK